jgi:hypothetical protein
MKGAIPMSQLDVRVVKLEPMRVACAYGFGKEPEAIAASKLDAWAKPRGFLDDLERHPTFGFDNPGPSPSSPNYGYELWMKVGPDARPKATLRSKIFPVACML